MSFAALRDVDARSWTDVASIVRVLAESVADQFDTLTAAIARLGPQWSGSAAIADLGELTALRAELDAAYPALVGVDQALSEFGTAVGAAHADLVAAIRPRPGSIVSVGADGIARLCPDAAPPDPSDVEDLIETARAIESALHAARSADEEVSTRPRLTSFDPVDAEPASVPPVGTDPAPVGTWWSSLSAAEQRTMIDRRPAVVDSLDGVPIDARDQAGRVLLHQQRAALTTTAVDHDAASTAWIQAQRVGVDRLEARLADPHRPRSYLLDLDTRANEAIVAIGNPDRATDVLTVVPGAGAGITDIGTSLREIDNVHSAADALAGARPDASSTLATVGWADYQAPPSVLGARKIAPAVVASPSLSRFDLGLRDTHVGAPAHDSIVGFSYGSTVIGVTARAHGLTDDDIVLVGSPDVGVDRAADLGVDPSHVWATVARADAIRAALDPKALVPDALRGRPFSTRWFGPSPTSSRFGAHVFSSDPGSWRHPIDTHQQYFEPGATSLINIARIATGDGADVT